MAESGLPGRCLERPFVDALVVRCGCHTPSRVGRGPVLLLECSSHVDRGWRRQQEREWHVMLRTCYSICAEKNRRQSSLVGVAALHLRPVVTPAASPLARKLRNAERAQPEAATEALLPVLVLPFAVRGGASAQRRDCAAEVGERRAPVGRDAGRVARPLDGAVAEL